MRRACVRYAGLARVEVQMRRGHAQGNAGCAGLAQHTQQQQQVHPYSVAHYPVVSCASLSPFLFLDNFASSDNIDK